MKTPIQELFEFMEQNQYFIGNDLFKKYQELLDKEKNVIIDAFLEGCDSASNDGQPISGKTWFNETFNTKEK